MADITMCAAKNCPNGFRCKRKLVTPSKHWQSYADFSNNCTGYKSLTSKPNEYGFFDMVYDNKADSDHDG